MGERVSYEHNLVDCGWVSDSEDETCGADQDVALAAAASKGYADASVVSKDAGNDKKTGPADITAGS
jgi:hypothetical protein